MDKRAHTLQFIFRLLSFLGAAAVIVGLYLWFSAKQAFHFGGLLLMVVGQSTNVTALTTRGMNSKPENRKRFADRLQTLLVTAGFHVIQLIALASLTDESKIRHPERSEGSLLKFFALWNQNDNSRGTQTPLASASQLTVAGMRAEASGVASSSPMGSEIFAQKIKSLLNESMGQTTEEQAIEMHEYIYKAIDRLRDEVDNDIDARTIIVALMDIVVVVDYSCVHQSVISSLKLNQNVLK